MPSVSVSSRDPSAAARAVLAASLGVTRIARITGLDRLGVEVASAIRPGGHVLQVTNGKGTSRGMAALGALLEAAELVGAERARFDRFGDEASLAARGTAVIGPGALDPSLGEEARRVRIAWRLGEDLVRGGPVLVPAQAVHCPPPDGPSLGPALLQWTSNGMGAHTSVAAAVLHAVLELAERDQLARAFPEGFTEREVRRRLIDPASLVAVAPEAAGLALELEARGLRVMLLDATGELGLPCATALLLEPGGPVPLAAGYACRTGRDRALVAALHEACQSRATEIHGAREDVDEAGEREEELDVPLIQGRRDAGEMPDLRTTTPEKALKAVLARFAKAGVGQVAAVPLDAPAGFHVVRAVAPGMLLSPLLM